MLLECPDELPADLVAMVENIGRAWATSPLRPRPDVTVSAKWAALLEAWAKAPEIPLLVRKHNGDRGSALVHRSGRILVPTDNSPAQWAFSTAAQGRCPTVDEVQELLSRDTIPIAMVLGQKERSAAKYRCTLKGECNLNRSGWKLGHIEDVGLNKSTGLADLPIDILVTHFIRLLSPSNMFVVPLAWAGLAELPSIKQTLATELGRE